MKGTRADPLYVHATVIAIGEAGILISGRSKAGKSHLAEGLMALATADGFASLLVGDDRVGLIAEGGHVLALPHPAIAGLMERRGTGILSVPYRAEVRLVLAIALAPGGEADPMADKAEPLPGLFVPRFTTGERPQMKRLFPLVVAALTP
jgi:HPr kinase/phosphorylase